MSPHLLRGASPRRDGWSRSRWGPWPCRQRAERCAPILCPCKPTAQRRCTVVALTPRARSGSPNASDGPSTELHRRKGQRGRQRHKHARRLHRRARRHDACERRDEFGPQNAEPYLNTPGFRNALAVVVSRPGQKECGIQPDAGRNRHQQDHPSRSELFDAAFPFASRPAIDGCPYPQRCQNRRKRFRPEARASGAFRRAGDDGAGGGGRRTRRVASNFSWRRRGCARHGAARRGPRARRTPVGVAQPAQSSCARAGRQHAGPGPGP